MKLLVATFFLSGVLSAPFNNLVDPPKTTKCDAGPSRFHAKKTLLYMYKGETISGLVGTSGVRSALKLSAKCQITPVSPCVFMLKITEAELLESQGKNQDSLVYALSSGSDKLRRELMARDLYFESNGGMIDSIRPEADEPTHILNMKRGILSAFQLKLINKDHTVKEVDVNGECKARYHVKSRHPSGKVKSITKAKDLSLCGDRAENHLGIPVTPYETDKSFSLLKSRSLCSFVVSPRSRVGKVSCEETHLFRPFSAGYNSSSGAMTTVRQTLRLIGRSAATYDGFSLPHNEKSSLKYEHSKEPEISTKNDREVRNILEKLAAENSAKPDSATLFSKLIFAIRRLDTKTLKTIWYRYYQCKENGRCTKEQGEKYQTFIADALAHCGTLHCAQFMVTIISEKKVGTQQSVAFLTGIALIGRPSEDMVGNILYFCQETPSRTAFLTLGTLVHKYCRQHSCDKLNRRSYIYQADQFLQSKLHHNCKTSTPEEVVSVTLALKAIGNAGRPSSAVTNILKCAVQPGPTVINIEALQALRRVPCSDHMIQGLLHIFDDLTVDTEIRIETYLALMRCPSEKVIRKIADILDKEKNKQVGSFVWSHLTNAMESTEPVYGVPLREIITKALGGRKLRIFNLDHLRFSHAYETSYYCKKTEVGGSSQAQVIFHPDSFFPRSAKFNLTVDVLGASINLLETAARFEGFETLIEQMFGSEGYFPDENLMKLLKIQPTQAGLHSRDRRDSNEDEMDTIKSNLEKLQDKMKIERKSPSGALSFKVFGHELQFLSFEDIDWLQGEADSINVIDTLINIARGGQVTYTKSFMFLEADHVIPTALGFPLKLAVNGSAVSSVNLKGKFDIRNMFWGKKKFDVRGFVTPSAVVDISGKMSVDAKHALSGIHVNSSLYTATEINGNATYKEGEGIKLSIEPPTKPVHIINVTANLGTFLNRKTMKISGPQRRLERDSCTDFTSLLGVKLCGHISSPMAFRDYNAPYFPLSGESSFGLVFQTTNADLARFELEGRQLTSDDDNRYDWIFNMHVPGLTFGRKIKANSTLQFLKDGKYLSIAGGIHAYKLGKFEAKYNNVTNGFYTKFSTPELPYLKPITFESEVFNKTNSDTHEQDIGISMNASYNKFTIQEVLTLFKHDDQYGFKSNLTYWPRSHITTEARFSIQKKSVSLKMDDTASKSKLFLAAKAGKKTNKFYVRVGNEKIKYGIKMNGEVNLKQKKILLDMFTRPTRSLVKFEAYPRENAVEKGFYMRLLHVNSSSHLTGYVGLSDTEAITMKFSGKANKQPFHVYATHYNRKQEKTLEVVAAGFDNAAKTTVSLVTKSGLVGLKYFASLNDKVFESNLDLYDRPTEMGLNFHAELMKKTVDVVAEFFQSGLRFKFTGAGKTVEAVTTYFTNNDEKGLKFNVDGLSHPGELIWAHYNKDSETGLKMSGSISDKSMEVTAGLFQSEDEKGLRIRGDVLNKNMEVSWSILSRERTGVRFFATVMRKVVEIETTVLNNDRVKELRINGLYDGKVTSLASTYYPQEQSLCTELTTYGYSRYTLCSQLIHTHNQKGLRLIAEGLGRKAEVSAGLIHRADEKGCELRLKYNKDVISDIFFGLVTSSSYRGLHFRAKIKERNIDALLRYTSTDLRRSVDLDLSIQGNKVTFESYVVREAALQGIRFNVMYQNKPAGSVYALLVKHTGARVLKIGMETARKNGIVYKLSFGNTKIEKKFASMFIVTANQKHYKYGWSIFYTNTGTNKQPNHLITTKLHYSRNKMLTSFYQMVNTEHSFNLLSKTELVPGQYLTNKFVISKPNNKLSVRYELLPGIGMTYDAAIVNNDQLLSLQSTLTVLDYPMNSSITLDKLNGELNCKFTYCPALPPMEITSHLRMENSIDVGFVFSAFKDSWNTYFLIDGSSKQVKLMFNVLPNVPVHIFAKIFDKNQFVFNVSTCSAFSVELAGARLTSKGDYQVLFKHQYKSNVYEDLKLNLNTLEELYKLRLNWDSKTVEEFLKNMDVMTKNLIGKAMVRLGNMNETVTKMTADIVDYIKTDGKDMMMMMLRKCQEKINILKEVLKTVKIDDLLEKYSTHATDMSKTLKKNWLKLVDEVKKYSAPLIETYSGLKKTLEELVKDLSPHVKAFYSDVHSWILRSLNRYRQISIYGITVDEMFAKVMEKTRVHYGLVVDKYLKEAGLLISKIDVKAVIKQWQQLAEQMKATVEMFTCKYDVKCTIDKVQDKLRKLIEESKILDQLKKWNEQLEKVGKQVLYQYRATEKLVVRTIKDKQLREKTVNFLKPIVELLKRVTFTVKQELKPLQEKVQKLLEKLKDSRVMILYQKTKLHSKELMTSAGEIIKIMGKTMKMRKVYLLNRIELAKVHLKAIHAKTIKMYKEIIAKVDKLNRMSWEEIMQLTKETMMVNYEKIEKQMKDLEEMAVAKVKKCWGKHSKQFQKIGHVAYTLSIDIINGQISLEQIKGKLNTLVEKVMEIVKEQEKKAMNKIKELKLHEAVKKTRTAAMELYKETIEDLRKRATVLYPKVMSEINILVDKVKRAVQQYLELTKSKILTLCAHQRQYLDKAVKKMEGMKKELVKKVYQVVAYYKKFDWESVVKMKGEMIRMAKVYEAMVKEAVDEYKLETYVVKVKQDVLDMVNLYKDMPIEDIITDLRKKANMATDKLLGFVIGETLSTYQTAMDNYEKLKKLYHDKLKFLKAKWQESKAIVQELKAKYNTMVNKAKEKYDKALRFYTTQIKPLVKQYGEELEMFGEPLLSHWRIRYGRLMLWCEHVKHMKFKDFYGKLKELLQYWEMKIKEHQETCKAKIGEWKGKVNRFIEEVKVESKNVLSRVEKVNEDVNRDAIATFRPYPALFKNIIRKHKDLSIQNLAHLHPHVKKILHFLAKLSKSSEEFASAKLRTIRLNQQEVINKIFKSLHRYPFLVEVMELAELVKSGEFVNEAMRYLNNCHFIIQVRTHKLWSIMKQEFLHHELVAASQQFHKSSSKKLRELFNRYYSHSVTIRGELRRQLTEKLTGMKKDLISEDCWMRKLLNEKHAVLQLKLEHVNAQLRTNGQKVMEDALNKYNSGMEEILKNLKYLGEMSLYDIQVRVTMYFKKLLAPTRAGYHDLKVYLEKRLQVITEKQHVMERRAEELRAKVMVLLTDSRKRGNEVFDKLTKWTNYVWTSGKSHVASFIKFSKMYVIKIEDFSEKTFFAGKEVVDRYIPYKKLLKMTPNDVLERVKQMPTTAIQSAEELYPTVKEAVLEHLESYKQAIRKFRENVNMDTLRQVKLYSGTTLVRARVMLTHAGEQMRFIAAEALETAVFLKKFYFEESDTTLYSRRPEFVEHVEYQLQHFINCTKICKKKAMKMFEETSKIMTDLYNDGVSKANYVLKTALPELLKYIRVQFKRIDIKDLEKTIQNYIAKLPCNKTAKLLIRLYDDGISMELLNNKMTELLHHAQAEIKKMDKQHLEKIMKKIKYYIDKHYSVVVQYLKKTYEKIVDQAIRDTQLWLENYVKRYEISLKVNMAKTRMIDFGKTVNKEALQAYHTMLTMIDRVKVHGRTQYEEILEFVNKLEKKYPVIRRYMNADLIYDLPTLLKNARKELPALLNRVKIDVKALIDDVPKNLHKAKLYLRNHVGTVMENHYVMNKQRIKNTLKQLKETLQQIITIIKSNVQDNLPRVKQQIKNSFQTIRQIDISLASGELKVKMPRLDTVYASISDMKTLVIKTCKELHPKIIVFYQDTVARINEALGRLTHDAKKILKTVKADTIKLYNTTLQQLHQTTNDVLIPVKATLDENLKEMNRLRRETLEACTTTVTKYYNKGKDIYHAVCKINFGHVITNYTRMLSDKGDEFVNDVKSQASDMVKKLTSEIKKMRKQLRVINDKVSDKIKNGKAEVEEKFVQFYKSPIVKRFVDMEDLMNKTTELSQDFYKLELIQNLVEFGSQCYAESRRLFDLTKESGEFALYVIRRAFLHNDIWNIVQEMTDPFHWVSPSNSIAMIFGRPHVYTFDGLYYKFVGYKKPSCTYVLAHDFRDKNFTLMSQETSLILNTKSGHVKIHANGQVEASVRKDSEGNEVNMMYSELPVEMMHVTVRREGSFITISHEHGLDVSCDLKHFLCTFKLSRFYHGKLAGLLGTNNNELYDEFMKPDKTVAKSTIEFANAWEVSGDPECKVSTVAEMKKPCSKKPSTRCKELFRNTSSPLAHHFKTLNPNAFYKACIFDTSDCESNVPATRSYCNVTAAYTALLREKGVWARQIPECASCGPKSMWQKWTQPGSKNVDVVLLVPETVSMGTHAPALPRFLQELDTGLTKYKPRYAIVGFGGKSGVYQRPHLVTSGGKIFGKINDVEKAIRSMKFENETADALDAIEYLALLPFHAGASKVVILIADQPRNAISSMPMSKAIKHLDMQGVIFNVIGPYFQKQQHRNVLGLWKGQAYLRKQKLQNKIETITLPSDDYIRLAESSQGGIFNLKAFTKSHDHWTGSLKKAMKTTLIRQIDKDQTYCRQCVCIPSLRAEPVTICRINRHARCS